MTGATQSGGPKWWLAGAVFVGMAALTLSAQAPAPAQGGRGSAAVTPAQGGRGNAGAANAQAGRGRGGRGGGPEVLAGGSQLSDEAYADYDFPKRDPLLPLRPDEQLAKFILQPGYRMELVLADPVIQEPAAINFDGNGRMFVLEIRGYMQDADAGGQLDPIGRVSLHEDTNDDGVYDKHSVFADDLVFPRFATPFGPNRLLVKESNAQELWLYTDTNGDGVADERTLFDTGYGRLGNVEHQESHLTWGLDNWMYSTENSFRARWTPPETRDGITTIRNYYDGNEFIKSTDPYFRPVDQTTAPDGTIYVTDLYHGIIQEATWSGPGTYLRARIEQYDLDKVIHHGRIWRLVYDGVRPDGSDSLARDTTMPRMNDESPAQLVAHLAHPNGWWRDTAQQYLVLSQDTSVVPALQERLRTSTNLLEKFHVLWTLEGLDALDAATVRREMQSAEPRMRIQAIRASETLYKAGDRSFAADYRSLASDPNVDVAIQAMLTMNKWNVPEAEATIKSVAQLNQAAGVQLVSTAILNPNAGGGRGGFGGRGGPSFTPEQQASLDQGAQIYGELCVSCHGSDGYGAPLPGDSTGATMAPRLAGSPRVNGHRDYVIKAVLYGLTGPIDGETYTDVMIPMNMNPDDWVAAVTSYVRTNFGNTGGFVSAADVAHVRSANASRETSWTIPELEASLPTLLLSDLSWTATASHNADTASRALSLTSWNSGEPQAPDMWFQVELPEPAMVTELQFASTGGGRGGGRGGGPPVIGYPRGYRIETSLDGSSWTNAAEGQGEAGTMSVTFSPVRAKFVRITQTATTADAPPWSIQQLRIYEAP